MARDGLVVGVANANKCASVVMPTVVTLAALAIFLPWPSESLKRSTDYSNSWAVEILGGREEADRLARNHGLANMGQVSRVFTCYAHLTCGV